MTPGRPKRDEDEAARVDDRFQVHDPRLRRHIDDDSNNITFESYRGQILYLTSQAEGCQGDETVFFPIRLPGMSCSGLLKTRSSEPWPTK